MGHDNCIFCKIVSGEIPAHKVYEDDHTLAFLDISQVTNGHTLVIPKSHKENIYELDDVTAKNLFAVVPKVSNSILNVFNPVGLNLINNNGEEAGQSVFHFHLHIIPRYGKGDGFGVVWKTHEMKYTQDDLSSIAIKIRQNIE
ncbi:MAG: hypothetical protein K0S51_979 [Bacillales bacterium]|jgi:histidine triad (HIT) family protein|nr:hypothetical protein [Bacillales bacterium]